MLRMTSQGWKPATAAGLPATKPPTRGGMGGGSMPMVGRMGMGYRDEAHPINTLRTSRDPFEVWGELRGF